MTNNDIKAQSIVELTTNKYFRRDWSSIYRALDNFYCPRNTLIEEKDKLRSIAREEIEKFLVQRLVNDQRNFIQIDTTPNSKKHSAKAIDRRYIRSSNNSKAEAGYEYSVVCIGTEPKWSVPVSIKRIKSDENKYIQGSKQVTDIIKQTSKDALNVVVGDASYSSISFVHPLYNEESTVVITRQRINRSIYQQYSGEQKNKGRKRSYGDKFNCNNSKDLLIPDEQETIIEKGKKGDLSIKISVFKDRLIKGKKQHIMSNKPMKFIKVEVLDDQDNKKYKRDLWLCVSGHLNHQISGKEAYQYYKRRFDIEHFFKFGKSKLLMDKFQTGEPNKDEDYMLFVMLAYNILYHAKSSVREITTRGWDKKVITDELSPSQVYRSMSQISFAEIVDNVISRGIPNEKNIRKNHVIKPIAPVIQKSSKQGKVEITIKSSFGKSSKITKALFNRNLELVNNIGEYKPEILAKVAEVFDKLCTQIE